MNNFNEIFGLMSKEQLETFYKILSVFNRCSSRTREEILKILEQGIEDKEND